MGIRTSVCVALRTELSLSSGMLFSVVSFVGKFLFGQRRFKHQLEDTIST